MAQLKQDMKGSKRVFSIDATDSPSTHIPSISDLSEAISTPPGIHPRLSPRIQLGPCSPVKTSDSPKTSFLVRSPGTRFYDSYKSEQDTSSTSLNTSRIYARFPAPPILVAPPPSPPPDAPDPTPRSNSAALQVSNQTNAVFLSPAARTTTLASSSIVGRPNEDLNRFVSSSTVSGTTLTAGSSGSFVKHPGPAQITRIAPEDIPSLPERVGKMVFDKVLMRWVKANIKPAPKASESSSAGHAADSEIDAESEDPFRDIESLRDDSLMGDGAGEPVLASTDNSFIDDVGDDEEMELTSFSFDGPTHSHIQVPNVVGEDDTTDSDEDDDEITEISALSTSLSLAGPPEIPNDPNPSNDEHGPIATAVVGTPGPSRATPMPTPIRSALKSTVASLAVSLVDPLARNYRTPTSKPCHQRSVSFSDGKREGPIRGLGRETYQDSSSDIDLTSKVPGRELSFVPSVRSKRIGEMLDGLQSTSMSFRNFYITPDGLFICSHRR
jgi:hypothetical protein